MSIRNSIGKLVSEKTFYLASAILLSGLPVVEVITEIIVRFDDSFIPSFFLPQVTGLFGILGTLLVIIYWLTLEPGKRKLRIADIFYFTLLLFMILSAVFSRNPGLYAGGDFFYCEDPTHFLAYYWIYFAGTLIDDPRYRKNLLYLFTGVAVLEGIFAFLQTFNIELAYSLYYYTPHTAYGLTQNSNYYGGLCVVFIAGISGMYFFLESVTCSKVWKYVLPAILAWLFYTMLGSRARLAWVGFAGLVVFYIISFAIMYRKDKETVKPALKRSLVLVALFSAVVLIAYFFTDYIREAAVRSYWEVANGNVEKVGSERIFNWKMGLLSVKDNWLTGVGLDNYRYVFESAPGYKNGMYVQAKAHNEYIHVLVTQGIPAFVNYMALLVYACSGAVKSVLKKGSKEKRTVTWILLGMFVTYCVQALFNGSVTYVAVYFWLVVGLITPRTVIGHNKNTLNSSDL